MNKIFIRTKMLKHEKTDVKINYCYIFEPLDFYKLYLIFLDFIEVFLFVGIRCSVSNY